jgi:hypothetical protein
MRRLILALTTVAAFATSAASPAAEIAGVTFADDLMVAETPLRLHGKAVMRWKLVMSVHASALWLPAGQDDPLADVVKVFELHYFHDIAAADFRTATEESLASSADAATIAALRPRIARFNALYQDIKDGQRYRLTYRPGIGTELAKDGVRLGTIEGADFAAAIFGIWLGPKAISSGFRDRMLGK